MTPQATSPAPHTAAGRALLLITTQQPGDDWPLWDSLADAERLAAILAIEAEAAAPYREALRELADEYIGDDAREPRDRLRFHVRKARSLLSETREASRP